jgi:hypothetical protein
MDLPFATRGFTPVGMSSRLRKAYVAAKFFRVLDLTTRARHSVVTAASSSGALMAFSAARLFDRADDLGRFGGFTELFLEAVREIFHEGFAFGRLRFRADDDRRQPAFQAGSRGKHDDGNDVSSLHLNIVENGVCRQIISRRTDYRYPFHFADNRNHSAGGDIFLMAKVNMALPTYAATAG